MLESRLLLYSSAYISFLVCTSHVFHPSGFLFLLLWLFFASNNYMHTKNLICFCKGLYKLSKTLDMMTSFLCLNVYEAVHRILLSLCMHLLSVPEEGGESKWAQCNSQKTNYYDKYLKVETIILLFVSGSPLLKPFLLGFVIDKGNPHKDVNIYSK